MNKQNIQHFILLSLCNHIIKILKLWIFLDLLSILFIKIFIPIDKFFNPSFISVSGLNFTISYNKSQLENVSFTSPFGFLQTFS